MDRSLRWPKPGYIRIQKLHYYRYYCTLSAWKYWCRRNSTTKWLNFRIHSGGGCDLKSIDGFGNGKFSPGPSPWPVGPLPNGLGNENGPPLVVPLGSPVRPPPTPFDNPWITVGFLKSNGSKCDFDWSDGGLKINLYSEQFRVKIRNVSKEDFPDLTSGAQTRSGSHRVPVVQT